MSRFGLSIDHLVEEVLTHLDRGERSKAVAVLVEAIEETAIDDKEAAAMLGVSRRTLQDYRQRGEGPPYFKVRANEKAPVRYVRREVLKYREQQRTGCTANVPGRKGGA